MNITTAFPSKYVKAAEIPEDGIAVTIDHVVTEDVDGKGQKKPVVYFRKTKKGLVLNVTNSRKIANVLGSEETEEWTGRSIVLFRTETEYAGDTVDCIRVRANKAAVAVTKRAAPPPPPPPSEPEEDFDDGATELTDDDFVPF